MPIIGYAWDSEVADALTRIGTSATSWEDAARQAVSTASRSLRDLRVAEVVEQDMTIEKGKVTSYRVKLNVSFKYEAPSGGRKKR